MSSLYPEAWPAYLSLLLVVLRLLGFFLLVPGFSHHAIPANVKTVLAFALSLAIFPLVRTSLPPVPTTLGGLALAAFGETAVGLLMGFGAYLTFEGINLGAQFVGYQMGFGSASLMDPQNQSTVSILVPFQGWIALMVFFFADLHHELIQVFVLSFKATRSADMMLAVSPALLKLLIGMSARLFSLAVRIAAPFTGLVLLCNVAIGVLSRLMPQMNVMLFSFPITILLGFAALYVLAPDLVTCLESVLGNMSADVMALLRTL